MRRNLKVSWGKISFVSSIIFIVSFFILQQFFYREYNRMKVNDDGKRKEWIMRITVAREKSMW